MSSVSVVMPVFNGERFVSDALASLERQTFRDLEIVVVDDGSSDGTWALLVAAAARDSRVRLVRHERNEGLMAALNTGLKAATGMLIARLDADDLAQPERLARQVAVMHERPDLVFVGSAYQIVHGDDSPPHPQRMPESDTAIRWRLLFDNPVNHSSVMFRRMRPDGVPWRYESFRCEDYDLWARMLMVGRGANLPDMLVTRREHGGTYTILQAGSQAEVRVQIALREIRRVWPGTRLTLADVQRIHRWDNELPSILGPAEILLCREIVDLLRAFMRRTEVDRREARMIAKGWAARILASVPDYRYGVAMRQGLLHRLVGLAPGLVARDLTGRIRRRV